MNSRERRTGKITIKKSSILGLTLLIFLLIATFAPIVSLRMPVCHASGSPWDDDDSDGIPNYLDRTEFNVTWAGGQSEMWDKLWNLTVFWVQPSGVGDFNLAVSELGITKANLYDVTIFVAMELDMLSFSNMTEFLYWLASYSLIDSAIIPDIAPFAISLNSSDGKFRCLPTLQYSISEPARMRTSLYVLNGSETAATLYPYFDTESVLLDLAEANEYLLSGNGTVSDIIEAIENGWDLIEAWKKGWDAIFKKVLEKLTDCFLKEIIDAIKACIKGESWAGWKLTWVVLKPLCAIAELLDSMKKLLKKIFKAVGVEADWWWWVLLLKIDPPEPDFLNEKVDIHLYDMAGNHLLGRDYVTNETVTSFDYGIYSGSLPHRQSILVSKLGMPYNVTIISKEPAANAYVLFLDDPLKGTVTNSIGDLDLNEASSGLLYVRENMTYMNQMIVSSTLDPLNPVRGEIINIAITVVDENNTAIGDADLTIRATNGTHTYYYSYENLGGGYYESSIDTSELYGTYLVYTVAKKLDFFQGTQKHVVPVRPKRKGPRKDLNVLWYSSPDAAFTALEKDEIDFIQSINLTEAQKDAVEADPTLQISAYAENMFVVWRKQLVGIVNEAGHGLENEYTFLNAYRVDCQPTRMGVASGPERLNILYSQWPHEYAALDRIHTHLISTNPYDLVIDQPWAAQDWEGGTWIDPRDGYEKAKVTFWLRKDVGIAAPVTGAFAGYYGARDVEFTIWYTYGYDDCWQWHNVMDVHHTKIIDDYTIEIYFDDLENQWSMIYAVGKQMPLLGPEDKLIDKLCDTASVTFDAASIVNDEYQFTTDAVVQVISADVDGTPIYEDVDYYIRAGYDVFSRNVFVDLTGFTPEQMITINYYRAIPDGAEGFYLGGNLALDWTDTMYTLGTHYPVAIEPYVGGYALLNKNLDFFLETPLLGEIDWKWTWTGTTKPRSGYYQISLYDAVKLLVAYGSRGDGVPSPNWFPGADIDATDLCHIGLYDAVTLLSKYGTKWGKPP